MSESKEINLNFKVPDQVVFRLKMIAFERKMKEKELLNHILEDYTSKYFSYREKPTASKQI